MFLYSDAALHLVEKHKIASFYIQFCSKTVLKKLTSKPASQD